MPLRVEEGRDTSQYLVRIAVVGEAMPCHNEVGVPKSILERRGRACVKKVAHGLDPGRVSHLADVGGGVDADDATDTGLQMPEEHAGVAPDLEHGGVRPNDTSVRQMLLESGIMPSERRGVRRHVEVLRVQGASVDAIAQLHVATPVALLEDQWIGFLGLVRGLLQRIRRGRFPQIEQRACRRGTDAAGHILLQICSMRWVCARYSAMPEHGLTLRHGWFRVSGYCSARGKSMSTA